MLGFGKYRYTLLVTVSAAALVVSVERGFAADLAPTCNDHWWFAAEGQYLLYDGDSAKYGTTGVDPEFRFRLKPDDGWGVGGEIGFQPACSPWSFLGRVRYGESNKDDDSHYSTFDGGFGTAADADHREHHIVADLEIGRDVGLGALKDGMNLRLFAGLRFAHFKGKGSYNYSTWGGDAYDLDVKREFTGIGPRIGFDAMLPLSEQFSLDLGAAGAVLFGKQKYKAEGHYSTFSGASGDTQDKRSKTVAVPNLEASAAFSWLISDNAKFSLGYRVDSYWDIYDNGLTFGHRDEGDRIIHGPFIKFTIGTGDGG